MMASAKSSICSKITSVRMREKKSESKKSCQGALRGMTKHFATHHSADHTVAGEGVELGTV